MLSAEEKDALADELDKLHIIISNWCMASAWPGKMPTPPFDAWERQNEIFDILRRDGVRLPKYFRLNWRERRDAA